MKIPPKDKYKYLTSNKYTYFTAGEDGEQSELSKRLTAMAKKVTQSSKTDIHKACWENDIVIVSYFLDIDAARPKEMGETKLVNMPDKTGNEEGQNPELFEGDDNTPLHYAAYQGHLELCKLLCDRGANVNATNGDGCTPLFLASQQNRIDVVRYLLEPRLSCQLSICDKEYGLSAFDVAASEEVTLIFKSTRHLEKPGPIAKPVIKPCTSDQKSQSDVIVSFQPYTESDSYKKVNASNSKGMDLPIRGYVVEVAEKTTHPQWDYRQTKVADSTTDQLFDDFDENKDGGVSRDELKGFLLHIDKKFFDHYKPEIDEDDDDEEANMGGDDERKMLDQLFAQLDADGSGIIDKREFIDFLRGEDACRISSAKKLKQKMEELEHKLVKPAGSDLSVRFTGLEEGKKYIARVAVVNGIGIGEWSGISRRAYTWSRPQRIENVKCITRGATRITLSYDKLFKTNSNGPVDPENAKAKEKEQCRLAEQVREILVVGQIDGTGKDTLFASSMDPYNEDCKIVVKKLKECCTYSFKMIARNKCGTSAKSNAVKVTTRQIGEKEEKETDLDLRNHRIYDES